MINKKTLQFILVLTSGILIGVAITQNISTKRLADLQDKNDKMYEIGTDMGTMGADFNKMYNLCREENKALLDKDYESVVRLFEEQTTIQAKIDTLYSKYQDIPQEIIDQYKFGQTQ